MKKTDLTTEMPTEIIVWSVRPGAPNPWMLVKFGEHYRALYWSLKRLEWMISTTVYVSLTHFQQTRFSKTKVSTAGIPLRQAIQDRLVPDFLSDD